MFKCWRILIFIGIVSNLLLYSCAENNRQAPSQEGDSDWKYLGLSAPGKTPVIFSPGIISTHRNERDFTISPSGHEMFYSLVLPNNTLSVILYLQFDGFFWSEPQVARFSGQWSDLEPAYSPDGRKIYFASKRPYDSNDTIDNWNIWFIEYTDQGWSNPIALSRKINTDGNEFYPSITQEGAIYFTASRDDSFGMEDIYVSYLTDGEYSEPLNLGDSINTAGYEYNACIAPDESFIIFGSYGRADGYGGGDLYISYKKPDGSWTKSKNMGKGINSDKLDYCPYVTRDQRFLFFTSQRIVSALTMTGRKNIGTVIQLADGIENGLGNIYWVAFDKDHWR